MVSVILPVFNSEVTIKRCIDSILTQKFKNFELVVINDGSTDSSRDIIENYLKEDDRIKLENIDNCGVSNARNIGINLSKGKYITFVDADDYLEDNYLEVLFNEIEKNDCELVICGYRKILKTKNIVIKPKHTGIYNNNDFIDIFENLYADILLNSPWNKIFFKNSINNYFDIDINLGEDLLFNIDYIKNIHKISVIEDILYNYVDIDFGNRLTSKFNPTDFYVHMKIFNHITSLYDKRCVPKKIFEMQFDYIFRDTLLASNDLKIEKFIELMNQVSKSKNYNRILDNLFFVTKRKKMILYLFKNNKFYCMYTYLKLENLIRKVFLSN